MTRTPDEIKKGLECLDKMQFFMGQRAGRELWNEKPHDVQEQDLEQYNRDAEKVRALIQQLEAQNAELSGKIGRLESQNRCFKENKESCEKRMIDLAQRMPRWISVEERLPDIDAEVLICTDEGLYDVTQYSGGERFWTLERNPDCWVTALGVTHWMPLPEPPKEE